MIMRKLFLFTCIITVSACANKIQPSSGQGIIGNILWISGNQMPSPDKKSSAPKPIKREIFIYELTKMSQVTGQAPVYDSIHSTLFKKLLSDDNGGFKVYLPVGSYSIFTKEDKGFFASIFDRNQNINPIVVTKNVFTQVTINVNYQATY